MDSAKIDELERLAAQATPGPWEHVGFGTVRGGCYIADCFGLSSRNERKIRQGMKNADYIVAACNAVPGLIARVRELERQRDKLLGMYCNEMVCSWCWLDKVCPHFDETIVRRNPNSEGCRETLRKWLEQADKEAGG